MKIYNQNKTQILENVDLTKGYLIDDEISVLIPEVVGQDEVSHYETIRVYENGGKDVIKVIDLPKIEAVAEHYLAEKIKVYIPYTEEELKQIKENEYEDYIDLLVREKYSISQEFAILRQKDTKIDEFNEYYNYVENCKVQAKIKFNK